MLVRESFNSLDYFRGVGVVEFMGWSRGLMEVEAVEVYMEYLRLVCPSDRVLGCCFLWGFYYDLGVCLDFIEGCLGVEDYMSSLVGVRVSGVSWRVRGGVGIEALLGCYRRFAGFFLCGGVYEWGESFEELVSYAGVGIWGAWKFCDVMVYMGWCSVVGMGLGLGVRYGVNEIDCDRGLGLGVSRMFGVSGGSRSVRSYLWDWGLDESSFIGEFSSLGVTSMELESLLCKWGGGYVVGSESKRLLGELRGRRLLF